MNECNHKWHLVSHTLEEGQTASSVRAECQICYSVARFEVELSPKSIRYTYKNMEQFNEDYNKHNENPRN